VHGSGPAAGPSVSVRHERPVLRVLPGGQAALVPRAPVILPWITLAVSVACTIAYAIPASGLPMPAVTGDAAVRLSDPLHIVGLGARSTPLVADAGETWRLLTCHFVHTSWMHLAFNLAFLFAVGGAIEQVVRRADYAALLVFTATVSAAGSLMGTPQVSAGASGLVFGTLGAAVTLGLRQHQRLGREVQRYFGLWVLPFLLVVFGFGIGNPSVDQASHLGGLVSGLVGGSILTLRGPEGEPSPWTHYRPLLASTALLALVLLAAPIVARGGNPPHRVALPAGATIEIPGTWVAGHGPAASFFTAGGAVKLEADAVALPRESDIATWYERRHGLTTASFAPHGEEKRVWVRGRPILHRAYRTWNEATPVQRDVYFIESERDAFTTVLAFETPWTWRHKYRTTHHQILGSYYSNRGVGEAPFLKVAALQ